MYKIKNVYPLLAAFLLVLSVLLDTASFAQGSAPVSPEDREWVKRALKDPLKAVRMQAAVLNSWARRGELPCWRYLELGYRSRWESCVSQSFGKEAIAFIDWALPIAFPAGVEHEPSAEFASKIWSSIKAAPAYLAQINTLWLKGWGTTVRDLEFIGLQTSPFDPFYLRNGIFLKDFIKIEDDNVSYYFLSRPDFLTLAWRESNETWGFIRHYLSSWRLPSRSLEANQGHSIFRFANSDDPVEHRALSDEDKNGIYDRALFPVSRNLAFFSKFVKETHKHGVAYLPSAHERFQSVCLAEIKLKEKKSELKPENYKKARADLEIHWLSEVAAVDVNAGIRPENQLIQGYLLSRPFKGGNKANDQAWIQSLELPRLNEGEICEWAAKATAIESEASADEVKFLKNPSKSAGKNGLVIRVHTASLGMNQSNRYEGNLTQAMRAECDGVNECNYYVPTDAVAGAKPGLSFQMKYLCEHPEKETSTVTVKTMKVAAPAEQNTLELKCGK